MNTVDELLNSAIEDGIATVAETEEPCITIDENRMIIVPESLKRIAVQYDHKATSVPFKVPKIFDDADLSQGQLYINYRLPKGGLDSYMVEDATVAGDMVQFNWVINHQVTEQTGNIMFLLCSKETDADNNEAVHWNSELCKDCYISEGLESERVIVEEEYPDLIAQLLSQVNRVAEHADEIKAAAISAKADADRAQVYGSAAAEKVDLLDTRVDTLVANNTIQMDVEPDSHYEQFEWTNEDADYVRGSVEIRSNGAIAQAKVDLDWSLSSAGTYGTEDDPIIITADIRTGLQNLIAGTDAKIGAWNTGEGIVTITMIDNEMILSIVTDRDDCGYNGYSLTFSYAHNNADAFTLNLPELTDIRVGADDTKYPTAGEAVRGQISDIHEKFTKLGCANALTETVTGEAIRVDDVSPVEHEVEVKITGVDDPTTVLVTRCGKNLANISVATTDAQNQVVNNQDGTITVNTTATSSAVPIADVTLYDLAPNLKVGETYTLSAKSTGSNKKIWLQNANFTWEFGKSAVITQVMLDSIVFVYASGNSTTAVISNVQLELGSEATDYEPYNAQSYVPATDGTVSGVKSVSPTMTLLTDTPGVTIEMEYEKDINKGYYTDDQVDEEIANAETRVADRIDDKIVNETVLKSVETKNVLDEIDIIDGAFVSVGGSTSSSTAYFVTDYIYVPAGGSLAVNGSVRFLTAYNESKAVIESEGVTGDAINVVFTAPADANRYVRLSFRHVAIPAMVTRTKIPQPYVSKDVYITDYETRGITRTNVNLLKYLRTFDGYTFSNGTPNLLKNDSYTVTDYIHVKAGTSLAFTGHFRHLFAYDENRAPIESSYVSVINSDYVFTAPTNADRYVRVCIALDYSSNRMITRSATVLPYAVYEDTLEDNVLLNERQLAQVSTGGLYEYKNMLTGKKWYACGDSFTADSYGTSDQPKFTEGLYAGRNKVYPYFIGNRCGMQVYNIASGGKTLAYVDGYNNCFADTQYMTIPEDADYITMYFGINDGHKSVPVGTIDDTVNTTFCGAWNVVLEYLITNHPFAHIGIIVSNGTTAEYVTATKQMAVKWGIPYLDLAEDDRVPLLLRTNRDNVCTKAKNLRLSAFRVSDTNSHPNADCHEYESRFIESWLMCI